MPHADDDHKSLMLGVEPRGAQRARHRAVEARARWMPHMPSRRLRGAGQIVRGRRAAWLRTIRRAKHGTALANRTLAVAIGVGVSVTAQRNAAKQETGYDEQDAHQHHHGIP